MPVKVNYTGDQIIFNFVVLVVALRRLSAAMLWLFLNAVGYLIALYPIRVYWD